MTSRHDPYPFKRRWKRWLVGVIDSIGHRLFGPRKRKSIPAPCEKILAVRIDQLGDFILTLPALKAIHEAYPDSKIDLVVSPWCKEIAESFPWINRVIVFKKNWFVAGSRWWERFMGSLDLILTLWKGRYPLAIDFRGDFRMILLLWIARIPIRVGVGVTGGGFLLTHEGGYDKGRHQVELALGLLKEIGILAKEGHLPRIVIEDEKANRIKSSYFANRPLGPRICIHAGASAPSKRWPAEGYWQLMNELRGRWNAEIFLVGSPKEEGIFKSPLSEIPPLCHDLIGQTSMSELVAILDGVDLFIGNDSGPAHIAACLGKPSVVIASGTNEARIWRPWSELTSVIQFPVDCSPCEERVCPKVRHFCMEGIGMERVLKEVGERLSHEIRNQS